MEYFGALLPILAVCGAVGAVYSLIRSRRRPALAFGFVGACAVILAVALYYGSV
jgi:hypothetical protein